MKERRVSRTDGTEGILDGATIENLARSLRGALLGPTDAGYDAARRVWNGMVDKRPASPAESETIVRWGRSVWEAIQPFAERAVYVNALEDAVEEGEHGIREAYGPNTARLDALKRKYDPTNFLAQNANVKPATHAA